MQLMLSTAKYPSRAISRIGKTVGIRLTVGYRYFFFRFSAMWRPIRCSLMLHLLRCFLFVTEGVTLQELHHFPACGIKPPVI